VGWTAQPRGQSCGHDDFHPCGFQVKALTPREQLAALLARADVILDGTRPWDIQVHEPRTFSA
jgi:hypothetical protein